MIPKTEASPYSLPFPNSHFLVSRLFLLHLCCTHYSAYIFTDTSLNVYCFYPSCA